MEGHRSISFGGEGCSKKGRYRIARNSKRQDNIDLFLDYVIDEAGAREILLSLESIDFSCILQNEHKGFEQERLYVFGKEVLLWRGMEQRKRLSHYTLR